MIKFLFTWMKTAKKNLVRLLKGSFYCFSKLLASKVLRPARVFGCFDVKLWPTWKLAFISSHKTPHDHFSIDFEGFVGYAREHVWAHSVSAGIWWQIQGLTKTWIPAFQRSNFQSLLSQDEGNYTIWPVLVLKGHSHAILVHFKHQICVLTSMNAHK